MAKVPSSTAGSNLLAAFGGSISGGEELVVIPSAEVYSAGCDLGGTEISSFTVPQGFIGQLGVPGTNVLLNLVGTGGGGSYLGELVYNGRGAGGYFEADATIKTTKILGTGAGRFHAAGGAWTTTDIEAGNYSLLANATLTNLYAKGLSALLLEDNATAITIFDLFNTRSNVLMKRGATTARLYDCEVKFWNRARSLATMTLFRTRLEYEGGNITSLTLEPGSVLDLRSATTDLTITNATLWGGAEIIYPRGIDITWTNPPTLRAGGPRWYES